MPTATCLWGRSVSWSVCPSTCWRPVCSAHSRPSSFCVPGPRPSALLAAGPPPHMPGERANPWQHPAPPLPVSWHLVPAH
ncbi:unnamed protein product [Gulo gulo]|uniref:Uncharacterized protein n=1 Tax=Gulo gulo TaxID=48420 RepID=A0A9X9LMX3_GULGU|nr:unnamed protein product [Gulo gulo]